MVVFVFFMVVLALFIVALVLFTGFLFMYWLIAYNYYRFIATPQQIERAYFKNITKQISKTPDYKQFETQLKDLINR